ncbi:uncharacterized protein SPPG_08139 [Spizellomyces punctatus DAOM BR117]|uniref:DUF262 domain-containing protein n=1 Tax=Spizellomyces punctatus (strain DAOM BR117) TaxID=645134 RepID=A0A0L0H6M0_SPIPD|nr:uncharacterized protein SPPG_08139 [Spizellomyces punctatus DAOM BR117]KNC96551.1 hypothetical protein SPPG_08139 [Spizellomyces punctatus DAOM BR117]|eukprot:XP_016604591.1 hypothetical protein SPPG_08139 [Spizellomyces punctatus DAOM BR117]
MARNAENTQIGGTLVKDLPCDVALNYFRICSPYESTPNVQELGDMLANAIYAHSQREDGRADNGQLVNFNVPDADTVMAWTREVSLAEIFSKGTGIRTLVIPVYQRPYTWGRTVVKRLLGDIYEAFSINKNKPYFIGSIVLNDSHDLLDEDGNEGEFSVVDGQQRLTTLMLIFAGCRSLCSESTQDEIQDYLEHSPKFKRLYHLREGPGPEIFRKYAMQNKENIADAANEDNSGKNAQEARTLVDAMTAIYEELEERTEQLETNEADEFLASFADYVYSRCRMICMTGAGERGGHRIFSTLNVCGVKLDVLDFVKASIYTHAIMEFNDSQATRSRRNFNATIQKGMNAWNAVEDKLRRWPSGMHSGLTRFHDLFLHFYRLHLVWLCADVSYRGSCIGDSSKEEKEDHFQTLYMDSFSATTMSETDRYAPMYSWCGDVADIKSAIPRLNFEITMQLIKEIGSHFYQIVITYASSRGSTVDGLLNLEKKLLNCEKWQLTYSLWVTIALAAMQRLAKLSKRKGGATTGQPAFWTYLETLMVAYMLEIEAKEDFAEHLLRRSFEDLKKIVTAARVEDIIEQLSLRHAPREGRRYSEAAEFLRRIKENVYKTSGPFATKYLLVRLNTCSYERPDCQPYEVNWKLTEVEHLLPVSLDQPDDGWPGWTAKQIKDAKNKLGNLLLLGPGQNKELSNKAFQKKQSLYLRSSLGPCPFAITVRRAGLDSWTYDDFEREQNDIIKRLQKVFMTPASPVQAGASGSIQDMHPHDVQYAAADSGENIHWQGSTGASGLPGVQMPSAQAELSPANLFSDPSTAAEDDHDSHAATVMAESGENGQGAAAADILPRAPPLSAQAELSLDSVILTSMDVAVEKDVSDDDAENELGERILAQQLQEDQVRYMQERQTVGDDVRPCPEKCYKERVATATCSGTITANESHCHLCHWIESGGQCSKTPSEGKKLCIDHNRLLHSCAQHLFVGKSNSPSHRICYRPHVPGREFRGKHACDQCHHCKARSRIACKEPSTKDDIFCVEHRKHFDSLKDAARSRRQKADERKRKKRQKSQDSSKRAKPS